MQAQGSGRVWLVVEIGLCWSEGRRDVGSGHGTMMDLCGGCWDGSNGGREWINMIPWCGIWNEIRPEVYVE